MAMLAIGETSISEKMPFINLKCAAMAIMAALSVQY
jgi:hypothetical protein